MQKSLPVLILIASWGAVAQDTGSSGAEIGQAMKQNAEALRSYSYKRRTEIQLKGQSRGERVDLVRYSNGEMVVVPLETPRPAEVAHGGPLRRRMMEGKIEKKTAEIKENVQRLTALLHQYAPSTSEASRALLEKAVIARTGPAPDADVKLTAKGVVKASDTFTVFWNPARRRPSTVEIATQLDEKPVRATIRYDTLPNGLYYPAHTTIAAPGSDLTVEIRTYDYTTSGGSR